MTHVNLGEEEIMKQTERRHLHALLALALGVCIFGSASLANAEEESRRGFYVGIDLGLTHAASMGSPLSGISHPTRCDSILYRQATETDEEGMTFQPPTDAACTRDTPRTIYTADFDPGIGFAGALSAGYTLDNLRFEVEYLHRRQGDDSSLLPGTTDVTRGKGREWLQPPSAGISDFQANQLFVNVYYDFRNDSPWTPYLGAGLGWARTSLRYENLYIRKSGQAYLDAVSDQDWPADADPVKLEAAGTVSYLNTRISKDLFGFQFLGGLDYALTERVSIGLKGRWARFQSIRHDAVWNGIRSHAPVLADGVTPYRVRIKLDNVEYWGMTIGLKYHF